MGLRKSAGISLEEVSNDINIPVIALEQIEAGTLGSFEDIYELKRYLVDYAKYLGYDTDKVIKEFNEYMFDHTSRIPSQEIVAAIKENSKSTDDDPDRIASPYTRAYPKEKTLPYIIITLIANLSLSLTSVPKESRFLGEHKNANSKNRKNIYK